MRNLYWQHMRLCYSSKQLVFIDETHTTYANLRRKYGYSLKGFPAFVYVFNALHGQGNGVCGISAMSLRGCFSATTTELNFDAAFFMNILEFEVLPKMNAFPAPESVLVMDNAP